MLPALKLIGVWNSCAAALLVQIQLSVPLVEGTLLITSPQKFLAFQLKYSGRKDARKALL